MDKGLNFLNEMLNKVDNMSAKEYEVIFESAKEMENIELSFLEGDSDIEIYYTNKNSLNSDYNDFINRYKEIDCPPILELNKPYITQLKKIKTISILAA